PAWFGVCSVGHVCQSVASVCRFPGCSHRNDDLAPSPLQWWGEHTLGVLYDALHHRSTVRLGSRRRRCHALVTVVGATLHTLSAARSILCCNPHTMLTFYSGII